MERKQNYKATDTLVNRERYASTIDKEMLKGLKEVHERTLIPVSKLLDVAIKLLIDEYKDVVR